MDEATLNSLPPTFTLSVDGKETPVRDIPFVRDAPDLATFMKNAYDAHREVGARIPVRLADTKPETIDAWRKEHLPKLYKSGILSAPPGSPDDYNIRKPEGDLPAGLLWDEEKGKEFAKLLHKHGASKELAAEILKFNEERMAETGALYKGTLEEGIAQLKKTFGADYDRLYESAGRMVSQIFNEEEVKYLEGIGAADHPTFLSVLMKLAPHLEADSSILAGLSTTGGKGMDADSVRVEMADIMFNKDNPKNKGYQMRDPAVMNYIDELYKKVYGDGKVEIT